MIPFPLLSFETTPILHFDLRKFTDPLGVKVDTKMMYRRRIILCNSLVIIIRRTPEDLLVKVSFFATHFCFYY